MKSAGKRPATGAPARAYLSGFGNHFATEALAGALPQGRNSPQRCAYGLYAEQFSGTRLHRSAAQQPTHLALPHPPGRGARRVRTAPIRQLRQPL